MVGVGTGGGSSGAQGGIVGGEGHDDAVGRLRAGLRGSHGIDGHRVVVHVVPYARVFHAVDHDAGGAVGPLLEVTVAEVLGEAHVADGVALALPEVVGVAREGGAVLGEGDVAKAVAAGGPAEARVVGGDGVEGGLRGDAVGAEVHTPCQGGVGPVDGHDDLVAAGADPVGHCAGGDGGLLNLRLGLRFVAAANIVGGVEHAAGGQFAGVAGGVEDAVVAVLDDEGGFVVIVAATVHPCEGHRHAGADSVGIGLGDGIRIIVGPGVALHGVVGDGGTVLLDVDVGVVPAVAVLVGTYDGDGAAAAFAVGHGADGHHVGAVGGRADSRDAEGVGCAGGQAADGVEGVGGAAHVGGAIVDAVAGGIAGPADGHAVGSGGVNGKAGHREAEVGANRADGHAVNVERQLVVGGVLDGHILRAGRQVVGVGLVGLVGEAGLLREPGEGARLVGGGAVAKGEALGVAAAHLVHKAHLYAVLAAGQLGRDKILRRIGVVGELEGMSARVGISGVTVVCHHIGAGRAINHRPAVDAVLKVLSVGQGDSAAGSAETDGAQIARVATAHRTHTIGVAGHGGEVGDNGGSVAHSLIEEGVSATDAIDIVAAGIASPGESSLVRADVANSQTRRSRAARNGVSRHNHTVHIGLVVGAAGSIVHGQPHNVKRQIGLESRPVIIAARGERTNPSVVGRVGAGSSGVAELQLVGSTVSAVHHAHMNRVGIGQRAGIEQRRVAVLVVVAGTTPRIEDHHVVAAIGDKAHIVAAGRRGNGIGRVVAHQRPAVARAGSGSKSLGVRQLDGTARRATVHHDHLGVAASAVGHNTKHIGSVGIKVLHSVGSVSNVGCHQGGSARSNHIHAVGGIGVVSINPAQADALGGSAGNGQARDVGTRGCLVQHHIVNIQRCRTRGLQHHDGGIGIRGVGLGQVHIVAGMRSTAHSDSARRGEGRHILGVTHRAHIHRNRLRRGAHATPETQLVAVHRVGRHIKLRQDGDSSVGISAV